jgi:hypothetical protein
MVAPVTWSFTTDTAPILTNQSPTSGASGVGLGTAVTATFDRSIQAASLSFTLTGPGGAAIAATVSYNDTTHTATLQPSTALSAGTVYSATLSGAQDTVGTSMSAPVIWSFTTAQAVKTQPTVSVNAVNLAGGVLLADSQLSGSATSVVNGQGVVVSGHFTFGQLTGTLLTPGIHSEPVTFIPDDTVNYQSVGAVVTVTMGPTISTQRSALIFNPIWGTYTGTITLTNTGATDFLAPIEIVLTNLTPGLTLINAAGTTAGNPYIMAGVTRLAAGASVTVTLMFRSSTPGLIVDYVPLYYMGHIGS